MTVRSVATVIWRSRRCQRRELGRAVTVGARSAAARGRGTELSIDSVRSTPLLTVIPPDVTDGERPSAPLTPRRRLCVNRTAFLCRYRVTVAGSLHTPCGRSPACRNDTRCLVTCVHSFRPVWPGSQPLCVTISGAMSQSPTSRRSPSLGLVRRADAAHRASVGESRRAEVLRRSGQPLTSRRLHGERSVKAEPCLLCVTGHSAGGGRERRDVDRLAPPVRARGHGLRSVPAWRGGYVRAAGAVRADGRPAGWGDHPPDARAPA